MSMWVYHLKKCEKNWGSPCWLRSGRPKCKLPSQLRKIVKATKRYGVKGMNLSGQSNILGNLINAPEMILNHQRAYMTMLSRQNMVNTIFGCMWQKCHALANLGWMYLCDFYTIFRKCYFEYILSKTVTKIGGHQVTSEDWCWDCHQVCLEATMRNKSSNHDWEKS